jgi:cyanate permease
MNTCANSAGGIAPVLTAYIAASFGWTRALDFAALMSFTAGAVWIFVDAGNTVERPLVDLPAVAASALSS